MIKNRAFMLGMGMGLILGALLLQLAIIGQGQTVAYVASDELTREELEAAAERLGLQISERDKPLMTEEEWRQKAIEQGNQAPEEPDTPKSTDAAAEPEAPEQPRNTSPETAAPQAGASTAKTPEQPAAPAVSLIRYQIAPGSNLRGVAEGLQKAGVLEDAGAFQNAATEQKINTKIRSGTYSFREGESFDSIITKITTPPK
ncbi:peptidase [Paenibacillus sp. P96]|uniref:Peptidase n=1 Tax=Paenibacillus zeirhizosphaerae TaxID=2987519 RepID=A0ABT9FS46_9BACL|nr:peptidase [Paenibacillus sp. P96]MDP4097513.1 peptidase [Paenibacillus sp. P96]